MRWNLEEPLSMVNCVVMATSQVRQCLALNDDRLEKPFQCPGGCA